MVYRSELGFDYTIFFDLIFLQVTYLGLRIILDITKTRYLKLKS